MDVLLPVFLSFLGALTIVILLYIFVLPKKRNGTFSSGFAQWLHNYFRFKKLYIDSVLRFLFTFATFYLICYGLFGMIAAIISYPERAFDAVLSGLGTSILGPIILRLIYELSMMLIMLVQNVMDINKKLDKHPEKAPAPAKAPEEKVEMDFTTVFSSPAPSYQPPTPVRPTPMQATAPVRPAPMQATAPIRPTPVPPTVPARPVSAPTAPVSPSPAQTIPAVAPVSEAEDEAIATAETVFSAKDPFVGEEY